MENEKSPAEQGWDEQEKDKLSLTLFFGVNGVGWREEYHENGKFVINETWWDFLEFMFFLTEIILLCTAIYFLVKNIG